MTCGFQIKCRVREHPETTLRMLKLSGDQINVSDFPIMWSLSAVSDKYYAIALDKHGQLPPLPERGPRRPGLPGSHSPGHRQP